MAIRSRTLCVCWQVFCCDCMVVVWVAMFRVCLALVYRVNLLIFDYFDSVFGVLLVYLLTLLLIVMMWFCCLDYVRGFWFSFVC